MANYHIASVDQTQETDRREDTAQSNARNSADRKDAVSTGTSNATSTRNLTGTKTGTQVSVEKADIGGMVSFSIPIRGGLFTDSL